MKLLVLSKKKERKDYLHVEYFSAMLFIQVEKDIHESLNSVHRDGKPVRKNNIEFYYLEDVY